MPRKPVFICSVLRGIPTDSRPHPDGTDMHRNIERAEHYCAWVLRNCNAAPFAPHGFYTIFLDDRVTSERVAGIDAGIAWLKVAKEIWVFVVNGVLSSGMNQEIELALDMGIPIRWFAVAHKDAAVVAEQIIELTHCADNDIPATVELMLPETANKNAQETIDDVVQRLANGESYEDLEAELDSALGTELKDRDHEAEEAWEGRKKG